MSFETEQPSQRPLSPPSEPRKPVHPLEREPPSPPKPLPVTPPRRRIKVPQSKPVFTYLILGINVLVFLLDYVLFGQQLTMLGMKENQAIINGEYWRLVTPMFLHGGIIHLGLNSYFLYSVGPQIERFFGYWRFLAVYLLSGISGAVASFALNRHPSIGASGALFGLVGAMLPLLYRNRAIITDTRRRIGSVVFVIVANLVIGLNPLIDNWGHAGGLVAGLILGWFATPRYVVRAALGDLVRLEDESSSVVAWVATILFGAAVAGVTLLLVVQRGGGPIF
jgi:rhomboid protease GluP